MASSDRPGVEDPTDANRLVRRVRCEHDRPRCRRPGADHLREPLAIVLDEADRASDDRRRTAVVHLEVDAPQPRQGGVEREHSADVRQPPSVDRLVVIADEEDPIGGCGQQQRHPELGAIEVLGLVDEQMRAATAPSLQQHGVRLQSAECPRDEVVEVEATGLRDRGFVRDEGPRDQAGLRIGRDRGRIDAQIQLEPRDRRVERPPPGRAGVRGDLAEKRHPIDERLDALARHRAGSRGRGHGTSEPEPRRPRRPIPPKGAKAVDEPLAELLRRPLVERDRGDLAGRRRAGRDEPRDPRDERGRLATPRRSHAEDRPGRRDRRVPLVRRETGEALGDGRMERRRDHPPMMPAPPYPQVSCERRPRDRVKAMSRYEVDLMPHAHGSAAAANRGRLGVVFGLTLVVFVVELVGGWLSNSLALLADAGHMFTDVAGIGLALLAIWFAGRAGERRSDVRLPATRDPGRGRQCGSSFRRCRGHSVGGLAAPLRAARDRDGPDAGDRPARLAANGVSLVLLREAQRGSLNMRGAYLEVMGDLAGSTAVIVAAVVIAATGWTQADAIASALIGLLIIPRTWRLLREAIDVLLEATPKGIDLSEVRSHILGARGVADVHDFHAWTITSGMNVVSAHVVLEEGADPPAVLDELCRCLSGDFDIEHSTFQLESADRRRLEEAPHA